MTNTKASRLSGGGPKPNLKVISEPGRVQEARHVGMTFGEALYRHQVLGAEGLRRMSWPADHYLTVADRRGSPVLNHHRTRNGRSRTIPWIWPANVLYYGDWEVYDETETVDPKEATQVVDPSIFTDK